jgi:hypothetical protein
MFYLLCYYLILNYKLLAAILHCGAAGKDGLVATAPGGWHIVVAQIQHVGALVGGHSVPGLVGLGLATLR